LQDSPWCVHPFHSMSLDLEGHYRLCCEAMQFKDTFNEISPKDFINSNEMVDIKETMMHGNPLAHKGIQHYCQRCIKDEQNSGTSRRKRMNGLKDYGRTFNLQISGFGNKCNLMCNHCSSHLSSKWSHFANKIKENDGEFKHLIDIERYKNTSVLEYPITNDQMFNEMIDFVNDSIDVVELSGGEVLINKKMKDFIIKVNKNKKIIVNTNGSLDTRIYKTFYDINPNIMYNVSFDGIKEIHELIRTLSNWNMYENNLIFFASNNIKIQLFLSLQSLNILQLKEILEYADRWPFDFDFHFVNTPSHLCISNLHPSVKKKAFDMLNNIKDPKIDLSPIFKLLKISYIEKEWNTLLEWLKLHEKYHNKTLHFEM
jgi:organic radical activating enzyme